MDHFALLTAAILLDRWIGDPDFLWRYFSHPVVWFGKAISYAENLFNTDKISSDSKRKSGWLFMVAVTFIIMILASLLTWFLNLFGLFGSGVEILIVSVFIAHKSLADHVGDVLSDLKNGQLDEARISLSKIVGRDTAKLDESQISKAAIESLAENFSDGVIAPVFWYALLGLPGIVAYKFINTADSMIGHKTDQYIHFGQGAALIDDWANFIPARLSVFLIAGAAWFQSILLPKSLSRSASRRAIIAALSDANSHRSPNAGWPEAAFAGALDISLGGARSYDGEGDVLAAILNPKGKSDIDYRQIKSALLLFSFSGWFMLLVVAFLLLVN